MRKWSFLPGLLVSILAVHAQTRANHTAEEYIALYHEAAVANMVQHRVPASITLAQGLFESAYGNSPLAVNANNHFGIKCHDWTGETYHHDDDAPQECFRKYPSVMDSYADHARFLKTRKRYAKCFELEITDYKGWARELKAAGYATLPTYPEKIVGIIERFKLDQYDRDALARMNLPQPQEQPKLPAKEPEKQPEIVQTPVPQKQPEQGEAAPVKKPVKPLDRETGARVTVVEKEQVSVLSATRPVEHNNGIPYIVARKGDTQASLADEFGLAEWQVRRYNELGVNAPILPDTRIYLAPKKDSNTEVDAHVVTEGENLAQIAQLHGIRKDSLREMNGLTGDMLSVGQTLKLH